MHSAARADTSIAPFKALLSAPSSPGQASPRGPCSGQPERAPWCSAGLGRRGCCPATPLCLVILQAVSVPAAGGYLGAQDHGGASSAVAGCSGQPELLFLCSLRVLLWVYQAEISLGLSTFSAVMLDAVFWCLLEAVVVSLV